MEHLTSEQLSEWQAYDSVEMIGGFRQEYQIAQVNAAIMNLAQSIWGKKGRRMSCSPKDFMPFGIWGDEPDAKSDVPQQSAEEMKNILLGAANAANKGKVPTMKRKKRAPIKEAQKK